MPRPKDDQALVFNAKKDVPIKDYIEELNNIILDPKSFLFGSHISKDRICMILASADLATQLVDKVEKILVHGEEVSLRYLVAKPVKILIYNAMHDISNFTLKKLLVKNCGVRTFSCVAEFKTSMDPDKNDLWNMKSIRRYVYIDPDDVKKLSKGLVRFVTPKEKEPQMIFFELDSPKCFFLRSSRSL